MQRKKIGLALGSGGFRGFAHIGAIRSLIKHGIPIDYISGSSIGALVGAYYAAFGEVDSLFDKMTSGANKKLFALSDIGFKGGIVSTIKFSLFLEDLFGHRDFSHTKIPFSAVATDLVSGQPIIFKKGGLAMAVRASCSVPLVFEPVKYRKLMLIDGGLSNPLPGKILKSSGADKVIGVNLYHKDEFVKRHFNMANVAMRSTRIALHNLSIRDEEYCDIIAKPNVSAYISPMGLKKYFSADIAGQMADIGEAAMNRRIPYIKRWLSL